MTGIVELKELLKNMEPVLYEGEFVFCTVEKKLNEEILKLEPIGTFCEEEGLTLILSKSKADQNNLSYAGVFCQISLKVHSSLEAVGLTAAFSNALKNVGVSANVIAGYYHDHIFVPKDHAEIALKALRGIS
ncbi:MAG: ACT domain-containing protein [Kordiimonadaceae bacterium]|jgi:uncharacterized protein|nr:ACT domain-containing protein [Kordiimonadaceae bacterium]